MNPATIFDVPEEEPVGRCPDCGRDLVVRRGKHGEFVVCAGYPECRHTQSVEDLHEKGDYSWVE